MVYPMGLYEKKRKKGVKRNVSKATRYSKRQGVGGVGTRSSTPSEGMPLWGMAQR